VVNNFAPPSQSRLARQVQDNRLSRQGLLVQAVAAAANERRGLAKILHDDVIQDLAGVSFALSSLGEHLDAMDSPVVERLAEIVRRDVEQLLAIWPGAYPRLAPKSPTGPLNELGNPLRGADGLVELDVECLSDALTGASQT
jgi:two-component system, NarL family, sensor kinase